MKLKKIISLLAAVTMLSSVMATAPVAQAAGARLDITAEAESTYDRTGYKAYTVTYAISGDEFTTTYKTDYSSDDEMWTISLNGGGLMSFGMKFTPVANVGADTTVLDRSFGLTTGTTKGKTYGWVSDDTLITNFDANTFKNGIIAYAGSPIALHTVEFDEETGGDGWTSGGTITESGEATIVKTVWYIAENSGYTIDYVYDELSFNYGTNADFTTYRAGSNLDVYINGKLVNADTAELTLGKTAPTEPTITEGTGKDVTDGVNGKVWNDVTVENVALGTDYKAVFTYNKGEADEDTAEFAISGLEGDEVNGNATFAVILKTAKDVSKIVMDIICEVAGK